MNINREDCKLILPRHLGHTNYELLNYSIEPISEDIKGYTGEYFLLTIEFKNQNDSSSITTFFLKTQPFQNQLQLEFSKQSGAFENEIFFYEKLILEYKKYHKNFDDSFIPKYYLSKENNAIVLENCTENGFKTVTKDTLDVKHLKIVLESLAKLHAASIIYEEKKSEELKRIYRLIEEYKKHFQDESEEDKNDFKYQINLACQRGILAIIDAMPERKDLSREEFKEKFLNLEHRLKYLNTRHRNVCCHGDMWKNNIMFKYQNGENTPLHCKLIDFQLMKYFPPVYDVLRLIYITTSTKWRQTHLDNMNKFYYECLFKEMKLGDLNPNEVLSYDQFLDSVHDFLPFIKVKIAYGRVNGIIDNIMLSAKDINKELLLQDTTEIVRQYNDSDLSIKVNLDEIMTEIGDVIVEMC